MSSAFDFINENRGSKSVAFNSGQKMVMLRAFYFINPQGLWTYYNIKRRQRHLLVDIENNWFWAPITKE